MAIAMITAGGVGSRTGNKVPKQFLTINDIPLIVYTMRNIERANCFDELFVVCSDGWKDFIFSYALQYNISIFKKTITGGKNRFDSYYNGLCELTKSHGENEIVSILDGNRPMTPISLFKESLSTIESTDCVLPLEPCYDSMYRASLSGDFKVEEEVERNTLFKGQSPETSRLGVAYMVCSEAKRQNENIDIPLTMLMLRNNYDVKYIPGSPLNFKITTEEDFSLFKAFCLEKTF